MPLNVNVSKSATAVGNWTLLMFAIRTPSLTVGVIVECTTSFLKLVSFETVLDSNLDVSSLPVNLNVVIPCAALLSTSSTVPVKVVSLIA